MRLSALAEKLADNAITSGAVAEDERELYVYAYHGMMAQGISWTSLILIGALFHSFWGVVVYTVMFIPLRSFAGGFHQRDYLSCYFTSLAVFLFVVLVCTYAQQLIPMWLLYLLFAAGCVVIFLRAPIADPNKPFREGEKVRYRNATRIVLAVEIAVVVLFSLLHLPAKLLLFAMAASLTVAGFLLPKEKKESDER